MKKVTISTRFDFPLYDIHIHFGEYRGCFFPPEDINEVLLRCGVNQYSAMLFPNTLPANKDRDTWLNIKMIERNSKVDLILVVTPEMIKTDENLSILDSLPYKMIKLHGCLHNWHPNGKVIRRVFSLAKTRNIPIMLHTGGRAKSDAGSYYRICSEFPSVKVILAHSRPIGDTINIMQQCSNVYADTSCVSAKKIRLFESEGLINRLLFGTDFPVPIFYTNETNLQEWYTRNISEIISSIGLQSFNTIANKNYADFFNLHRNTIFN